MSLLPLLLLACTSGDELAVARVGAYGDRVGGMTLSTRSTGDGAHGLAEDVTVTVWTRAGDGDDWTEADTLVGEPGTASLEVSLVADNSGSETGYLEPMQEAVGVMGDHVLGRGADDRVGLTRVTTQSEIVLPLTDDSAAWAAAVDDLFIANGWTALWDGVRLGHDVLQADVGVTDGSTGTEACLSQVARTMVVFTDGQENNSADEHPTSYAGDGVDTSLLDLYDLEVMGVQTPIHTIGIGTGVDADALSALASATGGAYRAIDEYEELTDALDGVVSGVEEELPVCFEPADCSHTQAKVRVDDGEESWEAEFTLWEGLCGCTRTRGYWTTHEEVWPVDSLELGGRTYSKAEALDLLGTSTGGDKSLQLASQLIASKLNVISGADDSDIADWIEAADAWLADKDDGDGLPFDCRAWGTDGEDIKDALDDWNNGLSGPGHCD
ncbi:MAG: VWA domain-containing protein [Alphaproteobacteria bacterium]|nr:VWA domain-containing protein [Alphaproteobacteria bacterium]